MEQNTHTPPVGHFLFQLLFLVSSQNSLEGAGEAVTPFQSRVILSLLCIANTLQLLSLTAPILPGCYRQGSVLSLWLHLAEIRVINKTSHSHSADSLDSQQEGMLHLKARAVISNVTQYVTKCHPPGFFFCNDSLKLYVMFAELPGRSSIMFHFKIRCQTSLTSGKRLPCSCSSTK